MKTLTLIKVVALIGLFAGLVADGSEVCGTVREGRAHVREGVVIDATCAEGPGGRAVTDPNGAFRLHVAARGLCTLTVRYQGHAPSLDVAVPTQHLARNLVLDQVADGYRLRSE